MSMAKKVLLVDDDPSILDFISLGLRYEGFEVLIAKNGSEALELSCQNKPDLAVLDWMLPDLPGTEVCRQLRADSDIYIIMLTARDDIPDRVEGLKAGADDYLVKPFHLDELLARIEAGLRRQNKQNVSNLVSFLSLTINRDTYEVNRGYKRIVLTPTEFKLLLLFVEHPRQVFSKDTILDRVWGYDYTGDTNIVEVYIGYLRKKLGKPPLIYTVRGIGYVLDSPARRY